MTIKLSKAQQKAVDMYEDFITKSGTSSMVISGFAGSGKSFLLQFLQELTENLNDLQAAIDPQHKPLQMYFTATTNKAAEVLREALKPNTQVITIHKLMNLTVENNYRTGKTALVPKQRPPIHTPHSIIVIDEASMINRELLGYIIDHMGRYDNCKVVFVGDQYQLPPVQENPCPVFNNKKDHAFLDEIIRQVAHNPIIQFSAKYRDVLDDPTIDWPAVPADNQHIFHYTDGAVFDAEIKRVMGKPHDPQDYKILGYTNARVRHYNQWIRSMHGHVNQYDPDEILMTNKPIMVDTQIVIPTDALVKVSNVESTQISGVSGYNLTIKPLRDLGLQYKIFQPMDWTHVSRILKALAKEKNWKAYFHIKEYWADLRAIHALTCHKSQGSTYKEVFVDLNNIGTCKKWYEAARLAYVAITRPSDKVHILGQLPQYPSKNASKLGAFQNAKHHLS